jgi:hypothetical protein
MPKHAFLQKETKTKSKQFCNAMQFDRSPQAFLRSVWPRSSGLKSKPSRKPATSTWRTKPTIPKYYIKIKN